MTVSAFLAVVQQHLQDAVRAWAPWARSAWCRKQRRHLRFPSASVVWVRDRPTVEWAEWGARQGYFEVQYMDGLAYLRPLAAKAA